MRTTRDDDSMRCLRTAASRAPLLDLASERAYLARIQASGEPAALSALLVSHLRLVLSIAQQHLRYGLPFEDLVAEGNLGLVEAARRFDLGRNTRFATYAAWWVRARIRRYTMCNRRIVGAPSTRAARRLLSSMRTTQRRLEAELGRRPTREQVAAALDVSPDDVATVEAALGGRDVPLGSAAAGGVTLASQAASPEELAASRELADLTRRCVRDALTHLEARERMIVELRMLTEDPVTLSSLGRELGISRERVRQLETHAKEKLRRALVDRVA